MRVPPTAHAAALVATLLVVASAGCERGTVEPTAAVPAAATADAIFLERAAEVGLDFTHFNGMSGEYYFCETVGPGGALFDYDGDGDLDLYLVQGTMLGPDKTLDDALVPPVSVPLHDRLYRNDLVVNADGSRTLKFTDVTEAARLNVRGYGMGVCAGDIDNDGDVDLYVTNFGANNMLRNNGDGTFTNVTAEAGTDDQRWSSSAAFVDFDNDGWLDLFVCSYVDFTYANHKECYSETSARDYCGPLSYQATPDRLFRNLGNGRFEDVSARAQITSDQFGGALGVVCADLNGDGKVDIYVANDGLPNQCWINLGNGRFRNDALMSGTALNENGTAEASMGVDAADFDGDGDEDLFMTHLNDETNTLYLNDGQGFFEDHSFESGLGVASRAYTGFGTAWIDYDNDGWLDLFIANGAVKTIMELARQGDSYPLDQTNQLFHNRGDGTFEEVTAVAGAAFTVAEVSRGAAFGDVDNDGDTDVVVLNNTGKVRLFQNQLGNRTPWIGLRLVDPRLSRDAYGARVELRRGDGTALWRRVRAAASYCAANDPRVLIGLGQKSDLAALRIHWPDGLVEEYPAPPVRAYTTLRRGNGTPIPE